MGRPTLLLVLALAAVASPPAARGSSTPPAVASVAGRHLPPTGSSTLPYPSAPGWFARYVATAASAVAGAGRTAATSFSAAAPATFSATAAGAPEVAQNKAPRASSELARLERGDANGDNKNNKDDTRLLSARGAPRRRLVTYVAAGNCGSTAGMTQITSSSACKTALGLLYPAGSSKPLLWIGGAMSPQYPCGCYVNQATSNSPGYYATSGCGGGGYTCSAFGTTRCACTRTVVAPVITGYTQTSFGLHERTMTYTVNTAIADNSPTHQAAWWESATDPTTYAITPSVPGGLSFNTATGVITGTPLDKSGQGTGPISYAITATNAAGTSAPFTLKMTVFEAAYPGVTQIEATCAQTVDSLVGTHFLKLGSPSSKTYYVNCPKGCDAGKTRADVYGCGGHGCLDNG